MTNQVISIAKRAVPPSIEYVESAAALVDEEITDCLNAIWEIDRKCPGAVMRSLYRLAYDMTVCEAAEDALIQTVKEAYADAEQEVFCD